MRRVRRVGSVSSELVKKSKEAALAAVQIFNNPHITFKSETFIVLMNIAWTYLLHAYYRNCKIEYRYFKLVGTRKKFDRTKHGAHKSWELERCLTENQCPIEDVVCSNLRFLIGLRHEIEHQMTTRIDDLLSARFQACCLNYNDAIKTLFNDDGFEKHLTFSLQFSTINKEQKELLEDYPGLPANIKGYISGFDSTLTHEEYNSQKYSYRLFFVPKTANHKGQADRVIDFIKSDSPMAEGLNREYQIIKETEKRKFLPGHIVDLMVAEGYYKFSQHFHTLLWKELDAKNPAKSYGVKVADKTWFWYENWIVVVREHCKSEVGKYARTPDKLTDETANGK